MPFYIESESESRSVMSNSLWPRGLYSLFSLRENQIYLFLPDENFSCLIYKVNI